MHPPPELRREGRNAALLLVAATALAYAGIFHAIPQFDDYLVIIEEPRVASLAAWWASMPGTRPLLKLSYALNRGLDSLAVFHACNLLVHLACVLVLWRLLRRLLPEGNAAAALLAALLFALHPVNTEAVTMLSGRSVSLSSLAVLASLLALLAGRHGLSLLLFTAAVAVRETALVLPALATLVLAWQGGWREGRGGVAPLGRALRAARWHWALAVCLVCLVLALPRYRELLAVSLATRDPLDNLLSQGIAIPWLLGQLLQPYAIDPDPRLPAFAGWTPFAAGVVAAWLLVVAGVLRALPRGSFVAFAMAWLLLALLPTNSLIARLDLANGRQLYLAAPPLFAVLALVIGRLAQRHRSVAIGLSAGLLALLATATVQRNTDFRSERAFWAAAIAVNPGNARAWNNYGLALEKEPPAEPGRAAAAYREALRLAPHDYKPAHNLRRLCVAQGREWRAGTCEAVYNPPPSPHPPPGVP